MSRVVYSVLSTSGNPDIFTHSSEKFSVVIQREREKDEYLPTYEMSMKIYGDDRSTFLSEKRHNIRSARQRVEKLLEIFNISN